MTTRTGGRPTPAAVLNVIILVVAAVCILLPIIALFTSFN